MCIRDRFHCNRKLPNNKKLYRRYLQYSESKNKVYCFSCKLFGNTWSQLEQNCITNWKHIGDCLKDHETSSEHYRCYSRWVDTEKNIHCQMGIDSEVEKLLQKEVDHWKKDLERLIAITVFVSEHNLAFQGSNYQLFVKRNGNFLGLVELLQSTYNVVMAEHIRKIKSYEIHDHHLCKTIQNELISLLGY